MTVGHEFSGRWFRSAPASPTLRLAILSAARLTWFAAGAATVALAGDILHIHTRAIGVHLDGAFAEYLALPSGNAWVHRDPIDAGVAAIFDPFGNAVHTALAFPMLGEDVLVTGAGPIGIMAGMVSKHAGCGM